MIHTTFLILAKYVPENEDISKAPTVTTAHPTYDVSHHETTSLGGKASENIVQNYGRKSCK